MGNGSSMKDREKEACQDGQTASQYMKSVFGARAMRSLKVWHKWSKGTAWCIPLEGTFDVWRWEKFITEFRTRLQTTKTLELAELWLQRSIVVNQQGVHKAISVRKKRIMYTWPEEIAEPSDPLREAEEALSGLTLLRRSRSAHAGEAYISPGVSAVSESVVPLPLSPTSQHSPELDSVNTLTPPPVSVPLTSAQAPETTLSDSFPSYDRFSISDLYALCEARGINTRNKNRAECIRELKMFDFTNTTPKLYPSLDNYASERSMGETVHVSPPMKPSSPQYTPIADPGTYPVRVQQYESAPDADGGRTRGERVVWHVPFTPSEIKSILSELPDYRTNPQGFARVLGHNQFSYGMSGTDCAQKPTAGISTTTSSKLFGSTFAAISLECIV